MGLFSNLSDGASNAFSGGGLPAIPGFGGGIGNLDVSRGGTLQTLADPLDLFGVRAGQAADKAAAIQAEQFNKVLALYKPFADAGAAQLPQLATDATAAGFGNNIGDILNGGALNPLIQQRQQAATAYLAARGLDRSGAAAREAANIPADLSMQIEQELTRRRQSIAGLGQTGNQGAAGGLEGIGQALAGGVLGKQQAQAQGSQNALGLIGGILGGILA